MRIVFLGTGEIAVPTFRGLIEKHAHVVGLVTQPDRAVGRHQVITASPLKYYADESGIPVFQPESLKSTQSINEIIDLAPDLLVVMAYGQILTQELLNVPRLGCINLHASLLPKHRGASCIQSAIDAGDKVTGVTLMHVVKELDAGDIIAQLKLPLLGTETASDVYDALAEESAALLLETLPLIEKGIAPRVPQNSALMTYAPKLVRHDGKIDWAWSASALERRIRAYHPWPGTYTTFIDAKGRQKVLKVFPSVTVVEGTGVPGTVLEAIGSRLVVACGQGALALSCLQVEGGKSLDVNQFNQGKIALQGMVWGE